MNWKLNFKMKLLNKFKKKSFLDSVYGSYSILHFIFRFNIYSLYLVIALI